MRRTSPHQAARAFEEISQKYELERNELYQGYLLTSTWRQKRDAVFRRAHGRCERCRQALATQVHHLSYANVGNEPLEDLQLFAVIVTGAPMANEQVTPGWVKGREARGFACERKERALNRDYPRARNAL